MYAYCKFYLFHYYDQFLLERSLIYFLYLKYMKRKFILWEKFKKIT